MACHELMKFNIPILGIPIVYGENYSVALSNGHFDIFSVLAIMNSSHNTYFYFHIHCFHRDPEVIIRPLRQKNLSKDFLDQLEEVHQKMAEAALRGR